MRHAAVLFVYHLYHRPGGLDLVDEESTGVAVMRVPSDGGRSER